MFAWLSLIVTLAKSTPEILGVLLEIKKMYDQYIEDGQHAQAMQKFTEALSVARTTKDTTQLTALVNNIVTGQPIN